MKDFDGGFFKASNEIFEIGLDPFQISVYLYLARCSNNNEAAFPSIRTISEKTGMGATKVKIVLGQLEDKGLIKRSKRYREDGGNHSNSYTIHTPRSRGDHGYSHGTATPWSQDGQKKELYEKELNRKRYIDFCEIDASNHYLNIYETYYKRRFNKQHPRVTEEQAQQISWFTDRLLFEWDIDEETFEEAVAKHFRNLPDTNDGKFFAFIAAAHRYFIG